MSLIAYLGLFAAVVATWLAITGPGEAALISAVGLASDGRAEIEAILVVTFLGTIAGGALGYWIGRTAGRGLLLRRGPFHRRRTLLLEKAEGMAQRHGFLASLISPGWLSGLHAISLRTYVGATALSGLAWTCAVGLGAFLVGPSILGVLREAGVVGGLVAVGLTVVVALAYVVRRARTRPSAAGMASPKT